MEKFKASRGGAKPRMLSDGRDWAIEMGQGHEKTGMYEWSERLGELARRVELPHWLAQARQGLSPVAFKDALAQGALLPPPQDIGESGGHIWLRPSASHGWAGSAVGVDEVVLERAKALGSKFKSLRFVGYDPGYQLAFQWRVGGEEFLAKAQRVQTKPQFMPQWMVQIGDLRMVVAR